MPEPFHHQWGLIDFEQCLFGFVGVGSGPQMVSIRALQSRTVCNASEEASLGCTFLIGLRRFSGGDKGGVITPDLRLLPPEHTTAVEDDFRRMSPGTVVY